MAQINPGNRLYLYQLLSREIGVGRQTLLPRVEEALEADGLCVGDLGCSSMRELCEQLGEFVKLTVFKKGYVYATVLANEEYDRALEQQERAGEKASGGKPWKRRRGAKALKPVKPRHVEPEPEPEPAPEPEPEPKPEPEPSISLTITYVPKQAQEQPTQKVPSRTAAAQSDLPQDFHRDVRCPDDQLSKLYQVLPPDVDPMATLEEDFRVARSTGTIEGTRSNVTFPLRFLRADGTGPVRVSLRRSAKAVSGKRWTLADVDAGEPAEVGLEGLNEEAGPLAKAERLLATTVQLGSWDEALRSLAESLAPDSWGPDRCVLRGYLALTFARVQAEGLLGVSEDGSRAWFETGILAAEGKPLYARLSACEGDIPWRLDGFSTEL